MKSPSASHSKTQSRTGEPLPHKLELYRLAVQHPLAEVAFAERVFAHYQRGAQPGATRLREDFAGTAAVASAWVALGPERRALAVERHGPTLRWARLRARRELGARARDLHLLQADVMQVTSPRVEIVLALNFSTFIYHDRTALRQYFANARRSLLPGGVLIIDAYGGPGAMRLGTQRRRVAPTDGIRPFEYAWEQRSYDAVTSRVDCRIHFQQSGRKIANAFRYDWRLWSLSELVETMLEADFSQAQVWCDRPGRRVERSGAFAPIRNMPAREDWVAYVVGVR